MNNTNTQVDALAQELSVPSFEELTNMEFDSDEVLEARTQFCCWEQICCFWC